MTWVKISFIDLSLNGVGNFDNNQVKYEEEHIFFLNSIVILK